MKLSVAIAADHGGFDLKNRLVERLSGKYDIKDLGALKYDSEDDYPDFAEYVAQAVVSGKAQRGVLVCGSGVGACIAANKVAGIRASLCGDTYSAHQGVEHDDMNVLCLGARVLGNELALELVNTFLNAGFINAQPYQRRLEKVMSIERRYFQPAKKT